MYKKFVVFLLFFSLCSAEKVLIFGGKTGWIGQNLMELFAKEGYVAIAASSRLENREDVRKEIQNVGPDVIVNAAGVTGNPNVDWCENNKVRTIATNIVGALTLAELSLEKNIHMINLGTGCIYQYDDAHAMGSGIGFKEEEAPNFHGSFYSHTKCMLDDLLLNYPNVLNLRLRMPLSADLNSRNFITKITKYEKVINVPNSMTVLPDLLPLIPQMAKRRLVGNYNFVNPGVISHNEILDLYKQYVDPSFSYKNFSVEEQDKILKSRRSNNHLDTTKLLIQFPDIPSIKTTMVEVMKKIASKEKHV